jgi:NADH-quinone oxidoreductase subunit J
MLTAQGPFISMKTGTAEWGISLAVGLMLYGVLAASVLLGSGGVPSEEPPPGQLDNPATSLNSVDLGLGFLGFEQATPPGNLPGLPGRQRTRMNYLLPFEIISVHLLVVLIGAAYLARAKRRRGAPS